MKSSQILASLLFGSFAAAAPFKRDLVVATEVVYETVVVYTTVYEDEAVAEATTTADGYFFEQPASSVPAETTTEAAATSAPAYTPSAVEEPSSVYTPPVQTPSPSSTVVIVSSAAPAPAPVETSAAPAPAKPTTTEAAYTPAPVSSAAPVESAPAAAPPSPPSAGGAGFSGDVTVYDAGGAFGACGKAVYDTDFVAALAAPAWGVTTHDVMTGESTNPWCGQKINVEANGKTVTATIMDLCPGCKGDDIDLSRAAWKALGMTEDTRIQGSWTKAS